MRVLGAHDDVAPRHVPRGDQRCEGRGGGRVLDVAVPAFGEAEQLSHPVCDAQLELRRGRGSAPDERDLVQRRGEQLGQNRRLRRGDGEVGEEARALPVRHGRQEKLVEVAQDVGELLRLLGSRRRQLCRQLAGLDLRKHRQVADPLEVARRPLERGGAVLPEIAHFPLRRRTRRRLRSWVSSVEPTLTAASSAPCRAASRCACWRRRPSSASRAVPARPPARRRPASGPRARRRRR